MSSPVKKAVNALQKAAVTGGTTAGIAYGLQTANIIADVDWPAIGDMAPPSNTQFFGVLGAASSLVSDIVETTVLPQLGLHTTGFTNQLVDIALPGGIAAASAWAVLKAVDPNALQGNFVTANQLLMIVAAGEVAGRMLGDKFKIF